jgi:hypothetical protein
MITTLLLLFQLSATPEDLTRKITELDAALFDSYNKCDLVRFASFLSEDLEFYHDQTGLSTGRQATVDAVQNNICGKVHRDLVPGTLSAYPLKGYGAVESGIHMFCSPKSAATTGKCPDGSGSGRFTQLWRYQDGGWKLTRIISYDHCNRCSTSIPPDYRMAPAK